MRRASPWRAARGRRPSPDGSFPASASRRDVVPGDVVEFGEFAAERSERAAAWQPASSWSETILSRHARRLSIPSIAASIMPRCQRQAADQPAVERFRLDAVVDHAASRRPQDRRSSPIIPIV
jgi:hypothetical protein